MKPITRTFRIATAAAVAVAATALGAGSALAATPSAAPSAAHASASSTVFVQSDNPAGNTVVAYDRGANGVLRQAGVYPTGGLGGMLAGSVVDHLASEGSLAYDREHHTLYAVNAGSDTVSVFAVDGDRLRLTDTVSSGGSFPVSIAVRGDLVYVANALAGGSIQGFRSTGHRLVAVADSNRGLGLDPAGAPQFTHTPGQIGFTPDGSALVVTTKAAANSIDVFPLSASGAPAAQPVVNTEAGAVPFGFAFDRAGRLEVTEVGPGTLATYTIGNDGVAHPVGSAATGQAATCWVAGSRGHFYTSNAGSGSLSGFADSHDGMLAPLGNTATDPGTVDAAASSDGLNLYVQTGAQGVVDEFGITRDGALTAIGSVTVPGGVGGEGIVAG